MPSSSITSAVLMAAEAYAREFFAGDASGHDVHHTLRVARTARSIAAEEGADANIAQLAALLHDVDDHKLSPDTAATLGNARAFLAAHHVAEPDASAVLTAIGEVSFSQNRDAPPSSLESACVRDADRRVIGVGHLEVRAVHETDSVDAHLHARRDRRGL